MIRPKVGEAYYFAADSGIEYIFTIESIHKVDKTWYIRYHMINKNNPRIKNFMDFMELDDFMTAYGEIIQKLDESIAEILYL